ncbi:CDP-alcohol phosphatidyltransferase family protein [Variovorax sp. J2P1-59]|uniref:CDP-alcohol phosphatidyltransferase family protein n=1 Tax=Variovorax flavidus TaxID=3053501 RepID=UPI0025788FD5|nr:CDP-alcohol phosphatidyltransferase family protein [Variovorax sp. J2P1-59]MDM0076561.1 CDP-alcohol phosphatidyltransferase family protein [Variovorax sp. J2P1-59]
MLLLALAGRERSLFKPMEGDLKTMTSQSSNDRRVFPSSPAAALRHDAWREALACLVLLTLLAGGAGLLAGLGPWFHVKAVGLFIAAFAIVQRGLLEHSPNLRFGPANRVTLVRLALVALLAAGVGEPSADAAAIAWATIVIATTAALLDALDGPLARARGFASEFGARFDMETDALMVLVLCLLVLHFDKAGMWIMAAGLMRYVFVLAAAAWPWLARPLPASQRRKAVCVAQITSLIVCLGPIVPVAWSQVIAAASLAALSASFGMDIVWLARRRHSPLEAAP